ncbi:hypothetical protein CEXT_5941 [Caerostris extrusa]|uniref:Uncharacterized protein n=1 Tax=Caerostris extrusa TaxID=172846 RepID=A0AAV4Y9Y2_CAEEX|nr:hypothetical protein CEXT_5941 [Caerostris extrusa]
MTTKSSFSPLLNSAPYKNYNYKTTHHKSYMKYMTTKTSFSQIFNTSPYRNDNYRTITHKPNKKYETTKEHDHFKVTGSFQHKTFKPTVSTIVNPQTKHATIYPHHFNKSFNFPDLPIFKWIKQRFLPTPDYNSSSKMDPRTTAARPQKNDYLLKITEMIALLMIPHSISPQNPTFLLELLATFLNYLSIEKII